MRKLVKPASFSAATLGFLALSYVGCSRLWLTRVDMFSYQSVADRRYDLAQQDGDFNIAVVFAQEEASFFNGVQMGFASKGLKLVSQKTLIGRDGYQSFHLKNLRGREYNLNIRKFSTSASKLGDEVTYARQIARDSSYVAVIGHSTSDLASLASVSYYATKLLYMAPMASVDSLTAHSFDYLFRSVATDEDFSEGVAALCEHLKAKSVGIFYERSSHSLTAVDTVQAALADAADRDTVQGAGPQIAPVDIQTLFEKSYDQDLASDSDDAQAQRTKREHLARLRDEISAVGKTQPDLIAIIGDQVAPAVEVWKRLQDSQLKDTPVIVYGALDPESFLNGNKRETEEARNLRSILLPPVSISLDDRPDDPNSKIKPGAIYAVTMFFAAESATTPEGQQVRAFAKEYENMFAGTDYEHPDFIAFQGYLAGRLLSEAMQEAVSIAPIDVAEVLRTKPGGFCVFANCLRFDEFGDLVSLEPPQGALAITKPPPIRYKVFPRVPKKE